MLNKRFIDFVNLIIRKSKKYPCNIILLFLFLFKIFHIKITISDSSFFFVMVLIVVLTFYLVKFFNFLSR